jgi:hypothetical protein
MRRCAKLTKGTQGSALLEFAVVLPLLVVFIVGIYDFSGAYNQKQKIGHAAQSGAIIAGGQPTSDMYIDPSPSLNPVSLQPVVGVIISSLAAAQVLPLGTQGTCAVPVAPTGNTGLRWTYTISGCSNNASDTLTIVIDRGVIVDAGPPAIAGTAVTVSYPYHWRFNSAIQLLFPGASYAPVTDVHETATVQNQM